MKKLIYLSLGLVVIILIYLALPAGEQKDVHTFPLAVADTAAVAQISLKYADGTDILLQRRAGGWIYEDSIPVRKNAIENLLQSIHRINLQSLPAEKAKAGIENILEREGVEVQIRDKNERILSQYLIGGTTPDERGTFAKNTVTGELYVVHIPGWEGSLVPRFVMKPVEWRSRKILHIDPDAIESVRVKYPRQEQFEFILKKTQDGKFTLEISEEKRVVEVNTSLAVSYLSKFNKLNSESFIEDGQVLELEDRTPFAIFEIKGEDRKITEIIIYPVVEDIGGPAQDRYFLKTGDEELFLVQHRLIKDILRSYEFFLR